MSIFNRVRLTALLFAIAAVTVYILWRRLTRDRPLAEPKCGQCGYIITGLPSEICPECGSDLRKVGISKTEEGATRYWAPLLAAWSVAMVLGAFLTFWLVLLLDPSNRPRQLERARIIVPKSGAYRDIFFEQGGLDTTGAETDQGVTVGLHEAPDSHMLVLEVSFPELTYRQWKIEELGLFYESHGPLDKEAVLDWMDTGCLDREDPAIAVEAGELFGLIDAMSQGKTLPEACERLTRFEVHGVWSVPPQRSELAWGFLVPAIWVGLWILGLGCFKRWKHTQGLA